MPLYQYKIRYTSCQYMLIWTDPPSKTLHEHFTTSFVSVSSRHPPPPSKCELLQVFQWVGLNQKKAVTLQHIQDFIEVSSSVHTVVGFISCHWLTNMNLLTLYCKDHMCNQSKLYLKITIIFSSHILFLYINSKEF